MIKHYRLIFLALLMIAASCGNNNEIPRPKAYLRIDLPENQFKIYDTLFPYRFEYSVLSSIYPDHSQGAEPFWINIYYPKFNAVLHLSYKDVKNNIEKYTEDSREFAMKHIPKADAINEKTVFNKEGKIYGLIYDIKGSEVACPYQFYVTDSTKHFLRGSLYFNMLPNNDSLAPVIQYIQRDIDHLITTLRWK